MNGCHWHLEMFALDRARGECTLANTAAGAQPVYVDISHSIRSIFTEKPPPTSCPHPLRGFCYPDSHLEMLRSREGKWNGRPHTLRLRQDRTVCLPLPLAEASVILIILLRFPSLSLSPKRRVLTFQCVPIAVGTNDDVKLKVRQGVVCREEFCPPADFYQRRETIR